jgi:hypothetical protein
MNKLTQCSTLATLLVAICTVAALSCQANPIPNRDPLGERFPTATGEALSGDPYTLPDDLLGAPAVLILGYEMDAQFDADRWFFGLLQAELDCAILEVPTIRGLVPSWISSRIDDGMRSGIPSEDWAAVVTLYGAAATDVVALTGNEKGRNVRVALLDSEGTVRWFHDRGFSAGKLLELRQAFLQL